MIELGLHRLSVYLPMCLAPLSAINHRLCCRPQSYKIPGSLGCTGAEQPLGPWRRPLGSSFRLWGKRGFWKAGTCSVGPIPPCSSHESFGNMAPLSLVAIINSSPLPEGPTPFVDGSGGNVSVSAHPPSQLCLSLQGSRLEKPSSWQTKDVPLSILGPSRHQTPSPRHPW